MCLHAKNPQTNKNEGNTKKIYIKRLIEINRNSVSHLLARKLAQGLKIYSSKLKNKCKRCRTFLISIDICFRNYHSSIKNVFFKFYPRKLRIIICAFSTLEGTRHISSLSARVARKQQTFSISFDIILFIVKYSNK